MWCKLSLALTIAGVTALCCAGALSAAEMRVTLLGTGTPTPRLGSFSASTLVEAGSERLIFDLGRGSTIRLFQKKIPLGSITAHFITHLHSDHVVGLPDIWLSGWLGTPLGVAQIADGALRAQGHGCDDRTSLQGVFRGHSYPHRRRGQSACRRRVCGEGY